MVHTDIIFIYTHMIQNNLRTPQLVGFARQLGCKNMMSWTVLVLDIAKLDRQSVFMSLHGPAGACIPVASSSPIHIFPIQHVLKHCGGHKHILYYIYLHNQV